MPGTILGCEDMIMNERKSPFTHGAYFEVKGDILSKICSMTDG